MPDTPNNLTLVAVVDADLLARLPYLTIRYLPTGAANFAAQCALGIGDAVAAFEANTGRTALRCVARTTSAWKRICVLTTLLLVVRQSTDERSQKLADSIGVELATLQQDFAYREDADASGALDESIEEAPRRVQEIRVLR